MNDSHCCEQMQEQINISLENGDNCAKLPYCDSIIHYSDVLDEYGLLVHDGGDSYISISFCPWCGQKLPESKRDEWFEGLERLGFESPFEQEIPEEFRTGAWRK